jgi:hypothetical protein
MLFIELCGACEGTFARLIMEEFWCCMVAAMGEFDAGGM